MTPHAIHWVLVAVAAALFLLFVRAYYADLSAFTGTGGGDEVFHDTRF